MSDLARLFPAKPQPQAEPAAQRPAARGTAWFAWWVAGCLLVLAISTYQQLAIQRRLLTGSRELERIVAESRAVSADTVNQLQQIKALDSATSRLDQKLARLGEVNGEIHREIMDLEATADAILRSVATMDGQAGESLALLREVAEESAALHATLLESQQVGFELSGRLARLVEAQEAINADLLEMTEKTQFLDRFVRGEQP